MPTIAASTGRSLHSVALREELPVTTKTVSRNRSPRYRRRLCNRIHRRPAEKWVSRRGASCPQGAHPCASQQRCRQCERESWSKHQLHNQKFQEAIHINRQRSENKTPETI